MQTVYEERKHHRFSLFVFVCPEPVLVIARFSNGFFSHLYIKTTFYRDKHRENSNKAGKIVQQKGEKALRVHFRT